MDSPGLHPAPILHADAKGGDQINCQYTHTTCRTGFMSECATSSLPLQSQPVLSTTDESFESTEDPIDIHQPPPHVIDYWFDQLGLSLDPTSLENPSNATDSPLQFPPFDGIDYVSSLLLIHVIRYLQTCASSEGISDWFSIVRLWNCEC